MTTSVSVIIVNYRTAALAIEAIESVLARRHGGRQIDVHVVDNGSPGDDAAILTEAGAVRNWGTRVTLHLESLNHGFGRGNNVALEALAASPAPPDYVFLLNPDARLDNEAIDILATALDGNPAIGIAGGALYNPDGSQAASAFRFPGIASEFSGAACLGPVSRLLRGAQVPLPPVSAPQPVDWVTGAAFLARFALLRDLRFFDPDFFLYFEETELMRRVGRAGQAVWHLPEARIIHAAGAATGMVNSRVAEKPQPGYWYDSWRLYHVKANGRTHARIAALAHLVGSGLNAVVQPLRGKPANRPRGYFRDFTAHVLRPLFLGNPLQTGPELPNPEHRRQPG